MAAQVALSKIGYRRQEAADFVGMKLTKFNQLVKQNKLPKPFKIDGCVVWDGRELLQAFDKLKGNTGSWNV